MDDLRDYGLPNTKAISIPTWVRAAEISCPNCGAECCMVTVEVECELVKGGKGISTYMGCPACPFASPAMTITSHKTGE